MTLPDFHAAITAFFINQWNKRTPIALANKKFSPPKDKPWVRLTIIDNIGSNASLGGQSTRYRDEGFVVVQVFFPGDNKSGTREISELSDVAKKIFRGQSIGGGWFRNCSVGDVRQDAPWLTKNMSCEYIFDEIS